MIYLVGVGFKGRLRLIQGRRITECEHRQTLRTITAGLERVVCESCGHVSVRYIEPTVRIHPDLDDPTFPARSPTASSSEKGISGGGCCSDSVEFLIPSGLACAQHAWREASTEQVTGSEPWIPISIDQRTNAS